MNMMNIERDKSITGFLVLKVYWFFLKKKIKEQEKA